MEGVFSFAKCELHEGVIGKEQCTTFGNQECTTFGNKSAQEMATRMHNCGVNKTVFSKFQKSAFDFLAGSFFRTGL